MSLFVVGNLSRMHSVCMHFGPFYTWPGNLVDVQRQTDTNGLTNEPDQALVNMEECVVVCFCQHDYDVVSSTKMSVS